MRRLIPSCRLINADLAFSALMGAALIADGALPVGMALTPIRLRKRRGGAQAQGVARLALIVRQLKALLFVRRHLPLCFCFTAKRTRPNAHFAAQRTRRVNFTKTESSSRSVDSRYPSPRHNAIVFYNPVYVLVTNEKSIGEALTWEIQIQLL